VAWQAWSLVLSQKEGSSWWSAEMAAAGIRSKTVRWEE